jgi:hypothetical protein
LNELINKFASSAAAIGDPPTRIHAATALSAGTSAAVTPAADHHCFHFRRPSADLISAHNYPTMPPKKRRVPDEEEMTSSSESSDSSFNSDDSEDQRKRKRKKRYSSDDEYDPSRDNVEQATSYRRSKKRQQSGSHQQWDTATTSGHHTAPADNPLRYFNPVNQMPAATPHVVQLLQQPLTQQIILSPSLAQLLTAPVSIISPVVNQSPAPDSSRQPVAPNVVIDLEDDDAECDGTVSTSEKNENVSETHSTPAPIESNRKSDFESKILSELEALVTPPVSLCMECETVCEELDDSNAEDTEPAVKIPCPEYEYGLRRTVFNEDLILTCETITEETDCSYSYPEEMTLKQRMDFETKMKAHVTYDQIYSSRQNSSYKITLLDLEETGETLIQFKERLRREMRAAAAAKSSHCNPNHSSSSGVWKQTASKSTGTITTTIASGKT